MKLSILFLIFFALFIIILIRPYFIGSTKIQFAPIFEESYGSAYNASDSISFNLNNLDSFSNDLSLIFNTTKSYEDLNLIVKITDKLNSIQKDTSLILLQQFSLTLNENNPYYHVKIFNEKTIDTLYYVYNWCAQFKTLSALNENQKSMFYNIVYDYWMTEIVRSMEIIILKDHANLYNIKYRALSSLCESAKYSPNNKTGSIEKVLYNLENSRFSYITGRFYLIFGTIGVLIFTIVFFITIISYYIFFKQIIKYLQK
jgi:hypothetical protein